MTKKILIVEDIFANRYMLTYLLKANGWDVAEAEDAQSALKLAPVYLPDVILMDIGLPGGMDGYSLVTLIRAIPQLEHIPIIAVTSYAMGGDRERALEAGCTGYIEKPIDADNFVSQINAILNAGR
jgi:two-component system, cell cycle response regulator DivK